MIKTMDELLDVMEAKGYRVTEYRYKLQFHKEASAEVREMIKDDGCSALRLQDALNERSRYKSYLWGVASMAVTFCMISKEEGEAIWESFRKEETGSGTA